MFRGLTGRPEPVLNAALVESLAATAIGVLVAFGGGWNAEQQASILALTAAVCAIIFGGNVAARARVTPVA